MHTGPVTLIYKSIDSIPLNLDVYLPQFSRNVDLSTDTPARNIGAVVYFHGGGLTVGNRRSWFPSWLQKRINAAGHAFISADYRLMPSGLSNAHGILEDINDVFSFVHSSEFETSLAESTGTKCRIDPSRIAVAGTSSGGTCAYLAAKHVKPRPRALLSIYAAGGDFFTRHWLIPKTTVFFRGRELLDPDTYTNWIYPLSPEERSLVVADSPNTYFPADHPTPGLPSNPRSKLSALYIQLGTYLDYYTGQHEPSLSATLRANLHDYDQLQNGDAVNVDFGADSLKNTLSFQQRMSELIPEQHRRLFPQLLVDSSWPPTFFYHGSLDSAVPVNESQNMCNLLRSVGVPAEITVVDGKEHSFDYAPDAEETLKEDFDHMAEFIDQCLSASVQNCWT